MSSVGQVVGGIVGAIVGFYTGIGPVYGAQIGMMVGGALDPPKGPDVKGPRLTDTSVQTSTYGSEIPRIKGTIATFGNIIWLQGNKLTETTTKNDSGGKGGSSSSTTTYSYSATFAVGLCKGPVSGIGKIWIGPNLVYNGSSTDPEEITAGLKREDFTLYLGNDTQLPDPLIQADRGIANTPAYRGLCYIVFNDLQLKDYGNSLMGAQVKVEVIAAGSEQYILEELDSRSVSSSALSVRNDYIYSTYINPPYPINVTNISDPQNMVAVPAVTAPPGPYPTYIFDDVLYIGTNNGGSSQLSRYSLNEPSIPVLFDSTFLMWNPIDIFVIDETLAYIIASGSLNLYTVKLGIPPSILVTTSNGEQPYSVFCSDDLLFVTGASLKIYDISNSIPVFLGTVSLGGISYQTKISGNYAYVANYTSGRLQVVDISDPTTPTIVSYLSCPQIGGLEIVGDYVYCIRQQPIGTNGVEIIDISNPLTPTHIYYASVDEMPTAKSLKCVGENNFYFLTSHYIKSWFFADHIVTSGSVTLGTIVKEECLLSNLLIESDLDVTELTDIVRGYKVSNLAAIRGSLETLRGAWPFDVVQHGYKLKFKRRGSSSIANISWDELDARQSGSKPGIQIQDSREMDSILPAKVSIKYFDVDIEYDHGEQYAERINTDAIHTYNVDMPIVFNASEAAQKADVLLYLYWLERYDVSFTLPQIYDYLEPGDVVTLTSSELVYNLRLTSIGAASDGIMECQAKYNTTSNYNSIAVGETGQVAEDQLVSKGSSNYVNLDIPTLSDEYGITGFPVAMGGMLSGWNGGELFRSIDLQSWYAIQCFLPPGSKIGFALTALSAHVGTMIDKASTLTIGLYQGELSSITEAEMLNGGNHFAYGFDGRWEIIAAQNCELQLDNTYILTDFLRGRFGTEWATAHIVGDQIVQLSRDDLIFMGIDSNLIGTPLYYKGVTLGKDLSTDPAREFTYQGVNLECLSPIYFSGNRSNAAKDWILTWIRRTRIGGEWRDYVDATLGETTQSYEIDIFSSATYLTLKRTLTAATPTITYVAADQVTDFGSLRTTLYVKVYQLSSVVGRGYPLTTTITG